MLRNSSGTYSLYTPGNPVVTNTVISSTWANNTLADLASALTDSLSRTGDGGMQAPLELTDGSAGAPALTFATETTSGFYRTGALTYAFGIGGTQVLDFTTTELTFGQSLNQQVSLRCLNPNTGALSSGRILAGVSGEGVFAITGTSNAYGEYIPGSGLTGRQVVMNTGINTPIMFATNDVMRVLLHGNGDYVLFRPPVRGPNGSLSACSFAFENDTTTGMYRVGDNDLGLAVDGTLRLRINSSGVTLPVAPLLNADGAVGAPSYSFASAPTTGMYQAADSLRFSTAGNITLYLDSPNSRIIPYYNLQSNSSGNATTPAYSWAGATSTGFYLNGTDIAMSLAGTGYPVGYRGMPSRTTSGNDSTAATDNGRAVTYTGTGGHTFTVDSDFGTAANIMVLINAGSASLAIAESLSGTMTWFNGGGSTSTGSRTLAVGGVATVWMLDANNAYVWGLGLS